jgi:hypothetical protein
MTPTETLTRIRRRIDAARDADDREDRERHVRRAIGDAVALRVQTDFHAADLEEQLTNVLVAPDEATHFLAQADRLLTELEDDPDGDPPMIDDQDRPDDLSFRDRSDREKLESLTERYGKDTKIGRLARNVLEEMTEVTEETCR